MNLEMHLSSPMRLSPDHGHGRRLIERSNIALSGSRGSRSRHSEQATSASSDHGPSGQSRVRACAPRCGYSLFRAVESYLPMQTAERFTQFGWCNRYHVCSYSVWRSVASLGALLWSTAGPAKTQARNRVTCMR